MGSLSLLQGIFPTQGSNPGLLHCSRILYQLSHKGSPRILEWVAIPSPGDLPNPGIEPGSPALQAESLPTELSGTHRSLVKTWRVLQGSGIINKARCCRHRDHHSHQHRHGKRAHVWESAPPELALPLDSIWQALNLRVAGKACPRDCLWWLLSQVCTPQGQACGRASSVRLQAQRTPQDSGLRASGTSDPGFTHQAASGA